MLELNNTILAVIDIQGNLAHAMHDKESLFKAAGQLINGSKCLDIPIILTEQNPKGLGPTIPEIRGLMPDVTSIPKISFSCCKERAFLDEVKKINKRQILISGIESHICIYQTTVELIDMGYEVHIVTDAVASRDPKNKELALKKMEHMGATMTCVEMALFELMKTAEHSRFRDIVKIIK
ncbi:MAG: hydrolase [Desulfatiglans sp.]|jgi:isochorismate hydrolase|nr:hydrolase [Desulfatiglans sp.]